MFDAPLPIRPKIVITKAIVVWLDQAFEFRSQLGPLCRINLDLEHRKLHALTIVAANPGDTSQARCPAGFSRAHVIGYKNQHTGPSLVRAITKEMLISRTMVDKRRDHPAGAVRESVPASEGRGRAAP